MKYRVPGTVKSPLHKWTRWLWLFAALGVLVLIALTWGKERKSWTEEVVLADGSTIEVKRRLVLKKTYYELFQAGLKPAFQQLRLPDGVTFETEDRLILLHLARGDAPVQWSVVTAPSLCATYDKFKRPSPAYIQFDYDGNGWNYRPVAPKHLGTSVNLLVSDKGVGDGAHIAAAGKPELNTTWRGIAPAYLKIDHSKSLERICSQPTYGRPQ